MLLLSVDTSGRQGSIALSRGAADGTCQVIEVVALVVGAFSEQLVPQIAALLGRHNFTKQDVDAFVVAAGPGSFTGLRVGLAAIKGLAEILQKPIAAVSLLEAAALSSGMQGKVVSALDAGRGDVYCGEYEIAGDSVRQLGERLLARAELTSVMGGAKLLTFDKSLADAASSGGVSVTLITPLDAASIAPLGLKKILSGDTVSSDQLEANYIRRSDAEQLLASSS